MSKKESAIRKINALRNITKERGATENEAVVAMQKMTQLLEDYNISMSELEINESNCKKYVVNLNTKKKHPIVFVAGAIAELTSTKPVLHTAYGTKERFLEFFGFDADIIVAGYMTEVVMASMETEYKLFFQEYKKSDEYKYRRRMHNAAIKESFQLGMAYRLVQRINKMIEEQKAYRASNSRELVVLKNAVVDEEFAKEYGEVRQDGKRKTPKMSTALQAGYAAAENTSLNRGLNNESEQSKTLD